MPSKIVKDDHFKEIAEVKADAKNRISLGKKDSIQVRIYKVSKNSLGQIVLDPQATIPAHEQWLFKNKEAAASVQRGLKDAREGRLHDSPEDFSKYIDKD